MNGTIISALLMLKIDISEHPFINNEIFEATVKFQQRGMSHAGTECTVIYRLY